MNENTISFLKKTSRLAGFAARGICAAAFFAVIFGAAVKLLWNWLMPEIFGIVKITFAQAVGLVVLSRLLVGGWHRGHHDNKNHKTGHDHFHKLLNLEFNDFPEDIRLNRKNFIKFWDERGKQSFEEYRNKQDISDI